MPPTSTSTSSTPSPFAYIIVLESPLPAKPTITPHNTSTGGFKPTVLSAHHALHNAIEHLNKIWLGLRKDGWSKMACRRTVGVGEGKEVLDGWAYVNEKGEVVSTAFVERVVLMDRCG